MVHLEGFPLALPIAAWLPYHRPAARVPHFIDVVFHTDLPSGGGVAATPLRGGGDFGGAPAPAQASSSHFGKTNYCTMTCLGLQTKCSCLSVLKR